MTPKERQHCPTKHIHDREELPAGQIGFISFPLFYGNTIFGIILCGANGRVIEIGEYMTMQISRMIYENIINFTDV